MYGWNDTFDAYGVEIHMSWKKTFDKMSIEERKKFVEHYKFGNQISFSRWFNQKPLIESKGSKTYWLCPIDGCDGSMEYTGITWPTGNPGYHHTCNNKDCGFTAAIQEHRYPEFSCNCIEGNRISGRKCECSRPSN